jgi:hypothetical protein
VVLVDPDITVSPERLYMQWEFLLGDQQVGLWLIQQDRDSLGGVVPTGRSRPGKSNGRRFNWEKGVLTLVVVGLVLGRIWRGITKKASP